MALATTLMTVSAVSGVALMGSGPRSMAQDGTSEARDEAPSPSVARKRKPRVKQVTAALASPAPAPPAAVPDIAAPLTKAGAGTCAEQVNALGGATMGGVASFNTAAHYAVTKPKQRPVSVFIGQKFATAGVPYAASGVFAAPNGQGGCDGLSVQVVPSPLSCGKLRELLSARGKQIGDLAGIPLMEDAGGQTMLVPTAADACVMVGVRSAYAK